MQEKEILALIDNLIENYENYLDSLRIDGLVTEYDKMYIEGRISALRTLKELIKSKRFKP